MGHFERLACPVRDHAQDLRDDVPGALDLDRVTDLDAKAGDLVFVMKRGIRHNDPADGHRRQARDRRQRARATNLDCNVFK